MDQPTNTPSTPRPSFPWRHVVVSVVITTIIIGIGALFLGAYIWRGDNAWQLRRDISALREDKAILNGRIRTLNTDAPLTDDTLLRGLTGNFLDLVLPPEPINYTTAATLLVEPLAVELRSDVSAIPRWLGIQDGPSAFAVFTSQTYETTATVNVGAFFGIPTGLLTEQTADRRWEFHFTLTSDGWKISNIEVRE